jgi:hypothetical protein
MDMQEFSVNFTEVVKNEFKPEFPAYVLSFQPVIFLHPNFKKPMLFCYFFPNRMKGGEWIFEE